jgi:hypothetical protein
MFGSDSPCDVEVLNQAFIDATQYINPIIANKTKEYNSLYRSKIKRGTFKYGEGYVKKSQTFYGGTAIQDCGASWAVVEPSRPAGTNGQDDPGHDSCRYESETISYGFEEKSYTLYQATRRTLDICLNDILFKWQFEKQLALTYGMLANVTLGEWEQIEREFYMDFANKYIVVCSNDGLGLETFSMTLGACEVDVPSGGFAAIGKLTQEVLDRFYQYLYRQAPSAAMGMKDGMPQFALITSPETSTSLIRDDGTRNTDMRYADPKFLIEGYGTVSAYQGYAHVHDPHAPRFKVNDDGTKLERVFPYATTPTTIGDAVNVSEDYIMAPFEISVIFLKNVYQALVPPSNPSKLAKAYDFNPADNMGEFHWINIQDRCENILREKGFFFGRFRIAPEPLENSTDAVIILHQRCTQLDIQYCVTDGTCDDTDIVACAQANEDDAAADATLFDVELEASIDCHPGQEVTVTFTGAETQTAIIVDTRCAPTYRIAFPEGVDGGWCDYDSGMASIQCSWCPEEEQ